MPFELTGRSFPTLALGEESPNPASLSINNLTLDLIQVL